MEKLFYKPTEVAETLGISRTGVYQLMNAGELPSVLLAGRNRRIPASSLQAFVLKQTEALNAAQVQQ